MLHTKFQDKTDQDSVFKADDLQKGDVLFFMESGGASHHVAIYNGKYANTHFITHAVSHPYYTVMTTRLKPEHFPYRVFRPASLALGAQAAARMRIWAEHQVPFSEEKHSLYETICDMKGTCHPKTGGKAQSELAQKYFAANFYRYIAFAAHPNMPYFPHSSEQTQGMYCSEALAAAFNIQQLLMLHAVKSCKELNTVWVSDNISPTLLKPLLKKIPREFKPSTEYFKYLETSRSENEYSFGSLPSNEEQPDENFLPSVFAWRYDKYGRIEKFLESYKGFYLPFDSKLATPWAILTYFEDHPEQWKDLGKLTVEPTDYPLEKLEENKREWQTYVSKLFADAEQKQLSIRQSGRKHQDNSTDLLTRSPIKSKLKRSLSTEDLHEALEFHTQELERIAEHTQAKQIQYIASPQKSGKACLSFSAPTLPLKRRGLLLPTKLTFESDSENEANTSTPPTSPPSNEENQTSSLTTRISELKL